MAIKKIIHVNQHVIKSNRKNNESEPVFTVKTYKRNVKATHVKIHGPCSLVYSPTKPLACGATVWIETNEDVSCLVPNGLNTKRLVV